jgi:hypothetical protein
LPFKTRETVVTETPAFLATSWIVTAFRFLVFVTLGVLFGIVTGNVIVIIASKQNNVNINSRLLLDPWVGFEIAVKEPTSMLGYIRRISEHIYCSFQLHY